MPGRVPEHRHHDDQPEETGYRPDDEANGDDEPPSGHGPRVHEYGADRCQDGRVDPYLPIEQQRERYHADRQHEQGEEKTDPDAEAYHGPTRGGSKHVVRETGERGRRGWTQ